MPGETYYCDDCGTPFIRFSTLRRYCDEHQRARALAKEQKKQRKPLPRSQKPIKQRGKVRDMDDDFRDKVVIPYLDRVFGRACAKCGAMPPKNEDGTYSRHAVDHVKGKGPHPELRFVITNFQYLCDPCHEGKTGVPQWTNSSTPGIDKKAMRAELDAAAKAVREALA